MRFPSKLWTQYKWSEFKIAIKRELLTKALVSIAQQFRVRTQVQFLAPTPGSSHPFITPAPGDKMPSSVLCRHLYRCVLSTPKSSTNKKINKNFKVLLSKIKLKVKMKSYFACKEVVSLHPSAERRSRSYVRYQSKI